MHGRGASGNEQMLSIGRVVGLVEEGFVRGLTVVVRRVPKVICVTDDRVEAVVGWIVGLSSRGVRSALCLGSVRLIALGLVCFVFTFGVAALCSRRGHVNWVIGRNVGAAAMLGTKLLVVYR